MARRSLFRQTALEHLASPEQLNSLPGLTARRLWLVLAAAATLVLGVALWRLVA
ncbi:MAG TPA: hypothetical protein VF244_06875 [Acidimicrobiales bacterium]